MAPTKTGIPNRAISLDLGHSSLQMHSCHFACQYLRDSRGNQVPRGARRPCQTSMIPGRSELISPTSPGRRGAGPVRSQSWPVMRTHTDPCQTLCPHKGAEETRPSRPGRQARRRWSRCTPRPARAWSRTRTSSPSLGSARRRAVERHHEVPDCLAGRGLWFWVRCRVHTR